MLPATGGPPYRNTDGDRLPNWHDRGVIPEQHEPAGLLVVDAANVVGSRPDGWWKDRAGAAERLIGRVAAAVAGGADPELRERRVVVVLEGAARTASFEGHDDVAVVRADGSGDDAIVAVVAQSPDDAVVVTSDRELRRRVADLGAQTRGAGWLSERLDSA